MPPLSWSGEPGNGPGAEGFRDKLVCWRQTNKKLKPGTVASVEETIIDLGPALNENVVKEGAWTSEIERSLPQIPRESFFLQNKAEQAPSAGSHAR